MSYAPFFLRLTGDDRIVIIGGGAIALSKAETLASYAARLKIVAPEILPELRKLVEERRGEVLIKEYVPQDLAGAKIIIAATNNAELNKKIHADARALGILVNVVDTPELCDFIFPAIVRRGPVQIAISSAGISPSLARYLKRLIEQAVPWNIQALAEWIKEKRQVVKAHLQGLQARRLFWDKILEGAIAQEVFEGNRAKAEALFAQALIETPRRQTSALYLIGAGPGHPDYITVRGAQLLAAADVVLYDRLIPSDALERYARREAQKIPVGKSLGEHGKTQEETCALIEEHLRAGRIVARLKGGDPGIYAHAAEEIEVARRLDVPWQIVPGVTAALGCAAASGFPLTERGGAAGVRFLTYYDDSLQDENFWESLRLAPNETLVFYMSTRQSAELFRKLLDLGFAPHTPVVLIEQGTTPYHAEYEATLGTFEERHGDKNFITPALLVIGEVVRWRSRHGWREPAGQRRSWFGKNKKDLAHAGE